MDALSFESPAGKFPALVNLGALKTKSGNLHNTFVINSQLMEERELGLDEIVQIIFDSPESFEEPLHIPLELRQAEDFFKRRHHTPGLNKPASCKIRIRTRSFFPPPWSAKGRRYGNNR